MPQQESSAFPENFPDPKLPAAVEVDEMLTRIKHSHGHYYKVMNLEVWALVETLDQVFPGAWGHFMANRQVAVKQFLQEQGASVAVVLQPELAVEKNFLPFALMIYLPAHLFFAAEAINAN